MRSKRAILIAEPDPAVAMNMATMLEQAGFSISGIAETAEDVIEKARLRKPDLIVMGVGLKGNVDGIEAAKQIRSLHVISIIYVTDSTDDDTRKRALATEPLAYLIQPTHVQLLAAVEIAFQQRQLAEANIMGKRTDVALDARSHLAAILEATTDLVASMAMDHSRLLYMNRAGRKMLGIAEDQDISAFRLFDFRRESTRQFIVNEAIPQALANGVWSGENVLVARDGREIPVSQVLIAHKTLAGTVDFFSTVARDITDQRQLEDQLRQSQKLEGIGKLAGGIAHDFNNLLTVILGRSWLLMRKVDDATRRDIELIHATGERAAALTRQLLAFSRKQILQPKVLDLNTVVVGIEKMLRRLIGEDIEIATVLKRNLGQVKADPGQIEQVILNLAVNARDAMPDGGKLTIETANVELDKAYVSRHSGVQPGLHVMLAISDNGCGMDAQTRSRIFEPFFTTKGEGKGTGLGLSTVYGIVQQSGGHIWVYGELGRGTTFKVYLPCIDDPVEQTCDQEKSRAVGTETILLVEDEEEVRKLADEILQSAGYTVLTAGMGEQALRISEAHRGEIHLVITDVVMPQMRGSDLAERLKCARSNMKVLFMSGYTDDAIVRHGVLDADTHFLQKPFTAETLEDKVREVLEASSASPKPCTPVTG